MNDNKKTKTKTAKAIMAAAAIMVVVASVAMIGIQTQMLQYALAKHAARDPVTFDETLAHDLIGYSGKLPTEPNVAPGCQVNACG
jgi:urocanate hydratase